MSAKLIGFDPMDVKCIRLATEAGLGNGHMDEIEVIGDLDTADVKKSIYNMNKNYVYCSLWEQEPRLTTLSTVTLTLLTTCQCIEHVKLH